MQYLITKTVDGRFVYYYGKGGIWQGLKDNAIHFKDRETAYDNRVALKKIYPNVKFGLKAVIT